MERDKIQEIFDRAGLSERQADAYTQIMIDGKTFRNAAVNMGITHRCVEEYVAKAKRKLSKPWIKQLASEMFL